MLGAVAGADASSPADAASGPRFVQNPQPPAHQFPAGEPGNSPSSAELRPASSESPTLSEGDAQVHLHADDYAASLFQIPSQVGECLMADHQGRATCMRTCIDNGAKRLCNSS